MKRKLLLSVQCWHEIKLNYVTKTSRYEQANLASDPMPNTTVNVDKEGRVECGSDEKHNKVSHDQLILPSSYQNEMQYAIEYSYVQLLLLCYVKILTKILGNIIDSKQVVEP